MHDPALARRAVDAAAAVPEVYRAQVLDGAGRVIARFDRPGQATGVTALSPDLAHLVAAAPTGAGPDGQLALDVAKPSWIGPLAFTRGLWVLLFAATAVMVLRSVRRSRATVEAQLVAIEDQLRRRVADETFADRLDERLERPAGGADPLTAGLVDSLNALLRRVSDHESRLRTRIAELIEARSAAETANRQKSDFLATVSHEIRTPMNGVLAMAEVMASNDLGSRQRERLDIIRQSGEAVLELLNDVLDLSRIEAGRLTLDVQPFDPGSLAESAAAAFRPLAATRGLMLHVDVADSARTARMGDPARIRQVLNNLLSNSLKFTTAGRVKLSLGVHDGELRITVSDTGAGIPKDRQDLLFQKFALGGAPAASLSGVAMNGPGAGLGLAICKDLCELMGGRIWAEADRTAGAAFHVALPLPVAEPADLAARPIVQRTPDASAASSDDLADSDAPVPEPDAADAPPHGVLRILAAEDNTTNRLVLEAMIGIMGFDMDIVGDGQQAVEALQQSDYDVVLMDIQMPVMDGITATREIRDHERRMGRRRTPIVAVSANVMTHQVAEYLAAGMDGHVPKPIELSRLHQAISDAIINHPKVEFPPESDAQTQNGRRN